MPENPAPGSETDRIIVGEVVAPHGIRGELKVRPFSDVAGRFAVGNQCHVSGFPVPFTVISCRTVRESLCLRFAEIKDRTAAESLRGSLLEIPQSQMGPLAPHSYWLHDIIGLEVRTETGQKLGLVSQILRTGANDVYEVAPDSSLGVSSAILLPAISEVIRKIDIEAGLLIVRLMPGLISEMERGGNVITE
jgi:16S rRNA processing protein RimM